MKVENRAQEKNYQNIQEIYDDIVDLAGYVSPYTLPRIARK